MPSKTNFLMLFFSCFFQATLVFANGSIKNPVISNLLQDSKPVSFVSWPMHLYMPTIDAGFNTYPQNLIKSGNEVYVFINGSGRLYKASNAENGNIDFTRIDSTSNFGYNIGSFGFSYENRIYNLGGYGYWRMNGQLRVFNEKAKQWDIVKLNKEVAILTGKTEGMIWYDVADKKIYTAYYLIKNEALKTQELDETQFVYDVMVLDLKKNEWTKLGALNSFLKEKLQIFKPLTMSPWGQMITIGDKISLLDFKNNQILSLDVRKEQYQSLSRAGWESSFYFKDSTLFYGNNNSLDSVDMHYSDFIPTNELLYTEMNANSLVKQPISYLYVTIPLTLVGISVLVFKKKTNAKASAPENIHALREEINSSSTIFDEMEIQLLQLLIQNTASGKPTSTEEQNKVLGLVKKSPEIQKKQRSDIIIDINRKYAFFSKSKTPIIQKERTEFDRRAYQYFIDHERLEEIRAHLFTRKG